MHASNYKATLFIFSKLTYVSLFTYEVKLYWDCNYSKYFWHTFSIRSCLQVIHPCCLNHIYISINACWNFNYFFFINAKEWTDIYSLRFWKGCINNGWQWLKEKKPLTKEKITQRETFHLMYILLRLSFWILIVCWSCLSLT